jgi:hypothetical protein
MRRCCKVLAVSAVFLLVASLPALAGSINNFSNVKLSGNSGSSVSGSFSFDNTTHVFSGISISFNGGVFGGVQANGPQGQGIYVPGQGYIFSWGTAVQGNWIWNSILFNPLTGQLHEYGGIYNWKNSGGFDYLSVPEGDAGLSYLMLSGMAVLAGSLISGKQRRTTRLSSVRPN